MAVAQVCNKFKVHGFYKIWTWNHCFEFDPSSVPRMAYKNVRWHGHMSVMQNLLDSPALTPYVKIWTIEKIVFWEYEWLWVKKLLNIEETSAEGNNPYPFLS